MESTSVDVFPAVRARDLRRQRSLAPGGPDFPRVLAAYLPLVFGSAQRFVPENPTAPERIAAAVFETFAFRWKTIGRGKLLASWLLRTTFMAAQKEREGLGLKLKPQDPAQAAGWGTCKAWIALKEMERDVLLLSALGASAQLDLKPRKLEKIHARATKHFEKRLRKRKAEGQTLAQFVSAAPTEVEASIQQRLATWNPRQPKERLAAATITAWQWIALGRFVRGVAKTVGMVVLILVALAGTFAFLIQHGYLNKFFMTAGQKGHLKEFPAMAIPAKPWPTAPDEMALAKTEPPKTSAELYTQTNIWLAKFSFTKEQWDGIEPESIKPIKMGRPGGGMVLRNPNASRSGLAGVLGIDHKWTTGNLAFAGRKFTNVAVRYRGNGTYINSLYGPKQSLKVDLNKHVKGQGIAKVNELNFLNSIADYTYIRDTMAERLFRELGVPAPRTAYAYVSVDVPGKFTNQAFGLYVLMEDIDGDFAADRFGEKDTPIFKPVTYDIFTDRDAQTQLGTNWANYAPIYDLKTKATPAQLQRVIDLAQLTSKASDEEFAAKIGDFLDLEEFAAFVAGHVLLSSYDGFLANGQNYYVYLHPHSNKFGFISWDQDHSWGEFPYIGTADEREKASIWEPSIYKNKFLSRVFKVEAFRALYREKLEFALKNLFTIQRLNAQVDELTALIRPAITAESPFRLERFDKAVATKWLEGPRDNGQEGPKAPIHQIRRFIEARTQSVRDQLDGKSDGAKLRSQFFGGE